VTTGGQTEDGSTVSGGQKISTIKEEPVAPATHNQSGAGKKRTTINLVSEDEDYLLPPDRQSQPSGDPAAKRVKVEVSARNSFELGGR
jgi:hypothetical protein